MATVAQAKRRTVGLPRALDVAARRQAQLGMGDRVQGFDEPRVAGGELKVKFGYVRRSKQGRQPGEERALMAAEIGAVVQDRDPSGGPHIACVR